MLEQAVGSTGTHTTLYRQLETWLEHSRRETFQPERKTTSSVIPCVIHEDMYTPTMQRTVRISDGEMGA